MTTRLIWLTDIHLEFLTPPQIETFVQEVQALSPDVIAISGDISVARTLRPHLIFIAQRVKKPVCFVLGNHDYYGGDIAEVRAAMRDLTRQSLGPVWLPATGIVKLAPDVALVGHGGWSDGRYGDYLRSDVMLNDYYQIKSLRISDPVERLKQLNTLGDEGADYLRGILPQAVADFRQIYILTHSPPFPEAHWHEGRTPTPDNPYLPHFTCKAIGDVLLQTADAHPTHQFTVLCGHTHGSGEAQMRPNLRVLTGGAEYGKPGVQRLFAF